MPEVLLLLQVKSEILEYAVQSALVGSLNEYCLFLFLVFKFSELKFAAYHGIPSSVSNLTQRCIGEQKLETTKSPKKEDVDVINKRKHICKIHTIRCMLS